MSEARWQLARLMDGYLDTQLLYIAAKLGVADALAEGPLTSAELADAVGADPASLGRVLRGLAVHDVVAEEGDGTFALTDTGACLRDGVPGSLRGAVMARGDLYFRAAEGLLPAVVDGSVAFERAYGEPFFEHLGRQPELEASFQGSMDGRSAQEAADVVAAYDFEGLRRLVDVGGGRGILLAEILRSAPALTGALFDRPGVVPAVERRMRDAGVAERCEIVAGDFFASVPGGADAYLLSRVIHDWDDADSVRILQRVREAMAPGSRLLLVEAPLPERAVDQPAAIRMDVNMLMLFSKARERTEAEYGRLLSDAGLTLQRVVPTRSPAGVSVLEALPN